MKRLISVLIAAFVLMIGTCASAVTNVERELIDYLVQMLNESDLEFIDICKFDEDSETIMLKLILPENSSIFKVLSDAEMQEWVDLYKDADSLITDGVAQLDIDDVTTVTVAVTEDDIPLMLFVNGVDQSWMLEK